MDDLVTLRGHFETDEKARPPCNILKAVSQSLSAPCIVMFFEADAQIFFQWVRGIICWRMCASLLI